MLFIKQHSQFDKEKKDSYQRGRDDERKFIEGSVKNTAKDSQAPLISFTAPVTATAPVITPTPAIPTPTPSNTTVDS